MQALNAAWRHNPPPAVVLRQLAAWVGIKPPPLPRGARSAPTAPADALQQAHAAGLPVMRGRPDDPMLAFLDLPPGARTLQ